jgi:hypothetical protein
LQDWHGPRRLTAQGQTTRQVFPQTILTQSSMKKKPVITPMKTHENPKFAAQIAQPCTQVPGLTNRCAASGKISGAVSSMKYGDAKDPRRNKVRIFAGRSGRTAESVFFFLLLAKVLPATSSARTAADRAHLGGPLALHPATTAKMHNLSLRGP